MLAVYASAIDGDDPLPPHLPAHIISRMCADNPLETFPRLKVK